MAASLMILTGQPKAACVVEADPAGGEVVRLGDGAIVDDRAGIADRDGFVLPIFGELFDAGDHLLGRERRARSRTRGAPSGRWRGSSHAFRRRRS